MDPLAPLAFVAGFLGVTEKILSLSAHLLNEWKNAPHEVRSLLQEAEILGQLIKATLHDDQAASVINGSNDSPATGQPLRLILMRNLDDSTLRAAATSCMDTLEEIHRVLVSIEKYSSRSALMQHLRLRAKSEKIKYLLTRLERNKSVFQMALIASSNERIRKMALETSGHRAQDDLAMLHQMSQLDREELERSKILAWLSKYDFQAKHLDAQASRLVGTGDWFWETSSFQEWARRETSILLLEGTAGSGKTILFSHIIDHFEYGKERIGDRAAAYLYFDRHDKQIQVIHNVLRSILRQLVVDAKKTPYALTSLWEAFGRGERSPDLIRLLDAIKHVIDGMDWVQIFLDGWDQVHEENRSDLMTIINSLCMDSRVSVLIATRPQEFVNSEQLSLSRYSLKATVSDLQAFISYQIHKSKRLETRADLQQEISERLCIGANGSFLWTTLQLATVLKQRSPNKMKQALNRIPRELLQLYEDELQRIMLKGEESSELAQMVLAILCMASWPLPPADLQHVLAICHGEDPSDADALVDQSTILTSCGFFVDSNDDSVTFIHPSVRDFCAQLPGVQDQMRSLREVELEPRLDGLFVVPRPREYEETDVDDSASSAGSDAFSQLSSDSTLVDSFMESSDGLVLPKLGSASSLSSQIVKILMTDVVLCGLTKVAVDILGSAGFERTFSMLLKEYSKGLLLFSRKESHKMAAIFIGQHTRQTASQLRSVVQPEDIRDFSQRASILQPNLLVDRKIEQWLARREKVGISSSESISASDKVKSKNGNLPTVLSQAVGTDETEYSDDEDLQDAWMNLNRVKLFLLEAPPFLELRLALTRHIKPDIEADIIAPPVQDQTAFAIFSALLQNSMAQKINYQELLHMTIKWFFSHFSQEEALTPTIPDHYKTGQTVFTWTCRCGETFTDSVLELVPGAAQSWVDAVTKDVNGKDHLEELVDGRAATKMKKTIASSDLEELVDQEGERQQQQKPATPSNEAGPSSPLKAYLQGFRRRKYGTLPWEEDDRPPRAPRKFPRAGEPEPRPVPPKDIVLLCVNQANERVKLVHYDVTQMATDRAVFAGMKERYQSEQSWRFILNTISSVEWRKFRIYLGDNVHIEVAENEEIPMCANGTCGQGCRCGCEELCDGHCGRGCYGYRYSPLKAEMIPPIPLTGVMHFLERPEDLGDSIYNRGLLPKRANELVQSTTPHYVEGWGLHFQEKVWENPIDAVKLFSIFGAIAVVGLSIGLAAEKMSIGNALPGALVLGVFQALAAWMKEWAERPLAVKPKKD